MNKTTWIVGNFRKVIFEKKLHNMSGTWSLLPRDLKLKIFSKPDPNPSYGYATFHYFQHLHLPKLYFTMDYVVFICNVLYFQCISMDSIGYYYKYFGKILPSWNHLCFMDFNDLYGNLYTIDISSYLVFTEKSKYTWNLRGQWFE